MIRNFLGNRRSFYETLLARLPDKLIRERIEAAAELTAEGGPDPAHPAFSESAEDVFLDSLKTLDLLKKPTWGFTEGRTTISIDEALDRATAIEEMGIILFSHLAGNDPLTRSFFEHEANRCKNALANLLRLHDELRYHRLSLIPPD